MGIVLENAIRSSQFVVLVLSPDAVSSEWVEKEFLFASSLKIPIIPIMYRACEPTLRFVNLKYIDVQGENYQHHFAELLQDLAIDPQKVPLPSKDPAAFHLHSVV